MSGTKTILILSILLSGYFISSIRLYAQVSIHSEQSLWYKTHPAEITYGDSPSGLHVPDTDTCSARKIVFGYHPYWAGSAWNEYRWNLLTDLCYFSYDVNPSTGSPVTLNGWETNAVIDTALAHGTRVHLCITLFSGHRTFFNSEEAKRTLIANTITLLKARGATGVNLDFEAVPGDLAAQFNAYIAAFADSLHSAIPGSLVSFASPAVDWSNLMDIPILSSKLDFFMVMAYDYYWNSSLQAGPVSGLFPMTGDYTYSVSRTLSWYIGKGVPLQKIVLGLPYYGRDWPVTGQLAPSAITAPGTAITYRNYKNNSAYSTSNQRWESSSLSPYFSYFTDQWRQCFIDNVKSLGAKYDLVNRAGIAGIGIWALSYDRGYPELWELLRDKFTLCGKATCCDTLYDSGGPVFSYYPDEKYCQTITIAQEDILTLEFYAFSLGAGDTLRIYDGESIEGLLLGTFTGNNLPPFITATENTLTIQFTSDASGEGQGWKAIYRCPTAGIPETNDLGFSVFPNPCSGTFFIRWDNLPPIAYQVKLYNLSGREVIASPGFRRSSGSMVQIETGYNGMHLPAGLYLGQIISGTNAVRHFKLLLQTP